MSSQPLPLPISDIIIVNVSVASPGVTQRPFNQGLIVGSSPVIPSYGSNPRIRQYPSLDAMLTDGFTDTDPEYLAAELYFSQTPIPEFVWIGRQDLTAIFSAIPHTGDLGTNYLPGDLIYVDQLDASNGVLVVLTVGAGGVVETLGTTAGNQGTGYSIAAGLSTTTNSVLGSGLEVDITAIGETLLEAVEACSLLNQQWYPFMCCGAVDADHLALAAWSTANWETALYFASSRDVGIATGTPGNLALQMQALKYKAYLNFDIASSSEYPLNIFAAAALVGLACGLNTGAPGSAFTLNLKSVTGVAPSPLTQAQFDAITTADCNVIATFGPYAGYIFNGVLESGDFFDQILDRAMLVNAIQINLMNLLTSVPKIPQTDAGEQQLIAQVEDACAQIAEIGYLAPGVWEGAPIRFPSSTPLSTGQSLPLGYGVYADTFAHQNSGDRAARKAMPIFTAILESGAVDSVLVNVNVQV